ncbi:hypothetical protein JOC37_002054 [Desulfohalotomaculum tongense]|uniref:spore coat associated protein CotJA n=1 Tax=Desulforadius tongensis TaxID=1216062 RepID=UPI001EE62D48|nr:spore coat associated protein CotJA [Desulforadius tongensis]MBM7855649.1 hypothetical protein [Desulforadius tongensis]
MKIIFKPGPNGDKEEHFKKPKAAPEPPAAEPVQLEPVKEEQAEKMTETDQEIKSNDEQMNTEPQEAKEQCYPGCPEYPDYPDHCPGCPDYPEHPGCPEYPDYPDYPDDPCQGPGYKCAPYPYPGYYYPLQCLGYAHIPWQVYGRTYSPCEAQKKGTLFPELYSPYYPDRKPPVVPIPYCNKRPPMLRKKQR